MALQPNFSKSSYAELVPAHRWFPADEALRETFYERLPPLVAKIREEVFAWRRAGHTGASAMSISLLRWWFCTSRARGRGMR